MAAGLLVLLGLGLFVGGILAGVTALYWACVGACLVAAVLLVLARRNMSTAPRDREPAAAAAQTRTAGSVAGAVQPAAPERIPETPPAPAPVDDATTPGAASGAPAAPPPHDLGEPPVEEVEVTDLLLAVDLKDEVLVVDEHPRYHLAGCVHLTGRTAVPLPHDEARTDGFTPCGVCEPDRHLADQVRARRAVGDS
jgi:hypothetical protein